MNTESEIPIGKMIDWRINVPNISDSLFSELEEISFPTEWHYPTSAYTVRQAILRVHNGKCAYEGNLLDPLDFQVDHVIPISLYSKKDTLIIH